ncbi:uncharacterized protein CLUP02_06387 [Colletotrichum lupini]|uniref:Uncharacterized protein n=1 Tax=Colletotrichum lupini TaxID=145971 RepID=A0A9Q8WFH8_9PEZI|nr:uncharacterized protein CLUP02_06387 [Colletotrichum lupini]UQC80902.1 hypothetical protein CLUP02_06387 [Colletotrichum lupini]
MNHCISLTKVPHTFVPSVFPSFALTPDRPQQRGVELEPDPHSQLKSSRSQSHVNVNFNFNFKHLLINKEGAKQAAAYVSTTKQQQQVKQDLEQTPQSSKEETQPVTRSQIPPRRRRAVVERQSPQARSNPSAKALVRGFMVRSDSKEGGPGAWKRKEKEATWEPEQDQK